MTQQENIDALKKDMKYSGFYERFNDLIEYHVKKGTPKFEIVDEAFIGDHRVEHTLYFQLGKGNDGVRHYYNGMQSTLYKIDIPGQVINGIDTVELEALLQKRPKVTYNDLIVGMDKFHASQQVFISSTSNKLQAVALGDPEIFNLFMVKYKPDINFVQEQAWSDAQKKIRENQTVRQFFKWSTKRITATEAPNLLYGRAVNKDLYEKNGGLYNTWLQLDFNSKKTDSDNYQWFSWHEKRGFNISDKIDEFNFKYDSKTDLIKNLRKGYLVEVIGIRNDNTEEKLVLEANPQKKTINIYANGDYAPHYLYKKNPTVQKRHSIVPVKQPPARSGQSPDSSTNNSGASSMPDDSKEPEGPGKQEQARTEGVINNRQNTAQLQNQHYQTNKRSGPTVVPTSKNKPKGHRHL